MTTTHRLHGPGPGTARGPRHAAICALLALLPVTALAQSVEVQVGTHDIRDFEFDWGRDGSDCPSCNAGAGNARLAYIDARARLWVGGVDPASGDFVPSNGRGLLVDSNTATASQIGNGPEWMLSQSGSQLVYTRWTDDKPHTVPYIQLGFARMDGDAWTASAVPGSRGRVLPVGSQDQADPAAAMHYQSLTLQPTTSMFWRGVYPGANEASIPFSGDNGGMTRRWVPGTRDVIITAPTDAVTTPAGGAVQAALPAWRQVYLYHTRTGTLEQLTFDPVDKLWAFMWAAPEFDNELVFVAVVDNRRLDVYRNFPHADGSADWQIVKSIATPVETPYVSSPEPFVYNGASWIFFSLCSDPNGRAFTEPSLIALSGVDPGTNTLRLLTSATDPPRQRRDPEYFITANGAYIYYNRYWLETDARPALSEGVFRVDTGLGPPLP